MTTVPDQNSDLKETFDNRQLESLARQSAGLRASIEFYKNEIAKGNKECIDKIDEYITAIKNRLHAIATDDTSGIKAAEENESKIIDQIVKFSPEYIKRLDKYNKSVASNGPDTHDNEIRKNIVFKTITSLVYKVKEYAEAREKIRTEIKELKSAIDNGTIDAEIEALLGRNTIKCIEDIKADMEHTTIDNVHEKVEDELARSLYERSPEIDAELERIKKEVNSLNGMTNSTRNALEYGKQYTKNTPDKINYIRGLMRDYIEAVTMKVRMKADLNRSSEYSNRYGSIVEKAYKDKRFAVEEYIKLVRGKILKLTEEISKVKPHIIGNKIFVGIVEKAIDKIQSDLAVKAIDETEARLKAALPKEANSSSSNKAVQEAKPETTDVVHDGRRFNINVIEIKPLSDLLSYIKVSNTQTYKNYIEGYNSDFVKKYIKIKDQGDLDKKSDGDIVLHIINEYEKIKNTEEYKKHVKGVARNDKFTIFDVFEDGSRINSEKGELEKYRKTSTAIHELYIRLYEISNDDYNILKNNKKDFEDYVSKVHIDKERKYKKLAKYSDDEVYDYMISYYNNFRALTRGGISNKVASDQAIAMYKDKSGNGPAYYKDLTNMCIVDGVIVYDPNKDDTLKWYKGIPKNNAEMFSKFRDIPYNDIVSYRNKSKEEINLYKGSSYTDYVKYYKTFDELSNTDIDNIRHYTSYVNNNSKYSNIRDTNAENGSKSFNNDYINLKKAADGADDAALYVCGTNEYERTWPVLTNMRVYFIDIDKNGSKEILNSISVPNSKGLYYINKNKGIIKVKDGDIGIYDMELEHRDWIAVDADKAKENIKTATRHVLCVDNGKRSILKAILSVDESKDKINDKKYITLFDNDITSNFTEDAPIASIGVYAIKYDEKSKGASRIHEPTKIADTITDMLSKKDKPKSNSTDSITHGSFDI